MEYSTLKGAILIKKIKFIEKKLQGCKNFDNLT